jgi:hypothetical protein
MVRQGPPQTALPPNEPYAAQKARGGRDHRDNAAAPMRFIGGLVGAIVLLPVLGLPRLATYPAFAQPAKGPAFYVVFNSLTKKCSVVDETPRTDTPNITVASDAIYPTRDEAEQAVKTLKPCNQ